MRIEGLFRVAASVDKLDELSIHMQMGNYYIMSQMSDQPHVVANFLKKVMKYMGEPLCSFKLYTRFRDLSGKKELCKSFVDVKVEEKAEMLRDICSGMPDVNKATFVVLMKFFNRVID